MESPRVLAVLKFREEVLNAMRREENQDDMVIFFHYNYWVWLQ